MSSYIDAFNQSKPSTNYLYMDNPNPVVYSAAASIQPIHPQVHCPVPALELLQLSSDSEPESTETLSPAQSLTFEYRIDGLTWVTTPITNTCHMDSFLSAFVLQVRQTHGKFVNKITYFDDVGKALIKIGEHALQFKNAIDSTHIRLLWIEAITQTTLPLPIVSGGREEYSVFQHLDHHSGFVLKQKCSCGEQYFFETSIRSSSLHDIKGMLTGTLTTNSSLFVCANCKLRREFVNIQPIPTNWVVTVFYTGRNNPDFKDIEQVFTLNGHVYKLGYLGYCRPGQPGQLGHFLSLQRIRGHWYKYRASDNPHYALYPNDIKYVDQKAYLETIVYFRV